MIDQRAIEERLARGHNAAIGVRYAAHGENWTELVLAYDIGLSSDWDEGILASGPIITMMDVAASFAVWVRKGDFTNQATLDLRVDYMRPALPRQAVFGRAECYRLTRSIAFVRGIAHQGDVADPVAHVVGTFMFLDGATL
ncbi:MAG: phenylacetic acid degradation protein [Sphingobium sp.]|uniref:PaaI family thioesterase n=1 Tax=Sphingobium sp. TaxID=1912891 RepID=UPI000DB29BF9|nr:PaaI family thioesterase [Sphingobium sp.]PZU12142.1 MAG: phenylacetic acid degradation protein [Sphingobium sp.]